MKEAVKKTYAKKGVDVIEKNYKAIELGVSSLIRVEVPEAWKDAQDDTTASALPEFVKELVVPMNRQQGEKLSVWKMEHSRTEQVLMRNADRQRMYRSGIWKNVFSVTVVPMYVHMRQFVHIC